MPNNLLQMVWLSYIHGLRNYWERAKAEKWRKSGEREWMGVWLIRGIECERRIKKYWIERKKEEKRNYFIILLLTKSSFLQTPLHYTAREGTVECLNALIKHGADMTAKDVRRERVQESSCRRREVLGFLCDLLTDVWLDVVGWLHRQNYVKFILFHFLLSSSLAHASDVFFLLSNICVRVCALSPSFSLRFMLFEIICEKRMFCPLHQSLSISSS